MAFPLQGIHRLGFHSVLLQMQPVKALVLRPVATPPGREKLQSSGLEQSTTPVDNVTYTQVHIGLVKINVWRQDFTKFVAIHSSKINNCTTDDTSPN